MHEIVYFFYYALLQLWSKSWQQKCNHKYLHLNLFLQKSVLLIPYLCSSRYDKIHVAIKNGLTLQYYFYLNLICVDPQRFLFFLMALLGLFFYTFWEKEYILHLSKITHITGNSS